MNTKELIKADFDAWCKWHQTEANLKAIWRYLRQPECRLILHMRLHNEGGVFLAQLDFFFASAQNISTYIYGRQAA